MSNDKAQQQQTQVATASKFDSSVLQDVINKIDTFKSTGELLFPKDYSHQNAIKSAWLILQETTNRDGRFVLEYCTKKSIANALFKMVVFGLSPLKKQCDFIPYGDKLSCDIEYTGNIALAKRYGDLKWIRARCIFEGDEFQYEIDENGRTKISQHKQKLENLASKTILGAYAVYELNDGTKDVEIMNIAQIREAWSMGGAGGNSKAHNKFPDQMCNKTVINRACKLLIRSSNDSVLLDDDNNEPTQDVKQAAMHQKIITGANNGGSVGFDDESLQTFTEPVADNKTTDTPPAVNSNGQIECPI